MDSAESNEPLRDSILRTIISAKVESNTEDRWQALDPESQFQHNLEDLRAQLKIRRLQHEQRCSNLYKSVVRHSQSRSDQRQTEEAARKL